MTQHNSPQIDPHPIFILGMNGSGTTMLLDCLNNHPELYGFRGETRVIPHFISKLPSYGDINNDDNFLKLWNDFRSVPILVSCNDGTLPPIPDDWHKRKRCLGSVIDGIFEYFSSLDGKRRWCEKTPMHALHISALARVFPGAKFIHMIRDGRDCAASFHRRWGYNIKRTICRWKEVILVAQTQGNELPTQYMELRYEDLTEQPDIWMRRICIFLNIEFNEKVLYLSRNQEFSGSTHKSITPNNAKWKKYYSQHTLAALDNIAGKQLDALGYPTGQPLADHNPSKVFRIFWALQDNIRAAIKKFQKEDKHTKYNFWAQVIAALRQILTSTLRRP
ncbi:MAG: hypothetical protein COC09_04165 [Gammaproteobacteria bacterium]|nr:sulfotransferase [Gammaproteobacteria bacterium]PCH63992.1 MAG: hypothetical protein COC09_04165 [Gammaproteobacteria bacterium]